MCIDHDEDIPIYGMDDIRSFALNVDLLACRNCGKTKEELLDYL